MKSFSVLFLACAAIATPLSSFLDQVPLNDRLEYPGFDLDLNAPRLVQMEGQAPTWMTELEKVKPTYGFISLC
jgi:leucyl aminopeptidase